MHRTKNIGAALALGTAMTVRVFAGDFHSCTEPGACVECVPACKATWNESKTPGKPKYSVKCEYAGARGRDPWHAPGPECRCCPPCGRVYVKKRLYKEAGEEKVERVPKYEVVDAPAACGRSQPTWWDGLCGCFSW